MSFRNYDRRRDSQQRAGRSSADRGSLKPLNVIGEQDEPNHSGSRGSKTFKAKVKHRETSGPPSRDFTQKSNTFDKNYKFGVSADDNSSSG